MNRLGEVFSLETFDGRFLFIPSSGMKMIAFGNLGASQITYNTRRIHLQDGVTEINFNAEPRNIPVRLFRDSSSSRQAYWNERLRLHEFLRPNRNGPLKLTLIYPTGDKRTLEVRADPGAEFASQTDDNAWNVDETINFVAYNPLPYNPDLKYVRLNGFLGAHLVFPITFPIQFGPSGFAYSGQVNYLGTWKTYPKITVTGPYTQAIIENVTTGKQISLEKAIASGESRILTLSPGKTTIEDANGVSKWGELGPQSDIMDFTIRPVPEVPEGSNEGSWYQATQRYTPERYYRFGEPLGEAQAVDWGTDSLAGVYNGAGMLLDQTGALGEDIDTAVYFDGTGATMEMPDINFGGVSYTFEFFVKPGVQTDHGLILTVNNGGVLFRISVNTNNQLDVRNAALTVQTAVGSVPQDVWTHAKVVFSLASGVTSIYLNGQPTTGALLGTIGAGSSDVTVGTLADVAGAPVFSRYVGTLDELAIYLDNFTPTQVAEKYAELYKQRDLYAVGGRQFFSSSVLGAGANTSVVIEYQERYYGL